MKIARLIDPNFTKIVTELIDKQIPIQTAFKLTKIVNRINEEIGFYQQTRREYLKRYAEVDEAGEVITNERGEATLTEENKTRFSEELNSLFLMEVDIGSISIDELGDISMSPRDLMVLGDLVRE